MLGSRQEGLNNEVGVGNVAQYCAAVLREK